MILWITYEYNLNYRQVILINFRTHKITDMIKNSSETFYIIIIVNFNNFYVKVVHVFIELNYQLIYSQPNK